MSPEAWATFWPKFYLPQQHPRVLLHISISRLFRLTIAYTTRFASTRIKEWDTLHLISHLWRLFRLIMTKRRRYIIDTALFHYIYLFVTPDKISGDVLWFRARWLSFGRLDWLPGTWLLHPRQTITQHTHPRSPFICAICSKFKLLDALDMSVNGKRMRQTFRNYFKIY